MERAPPSSSSELVPPLPAKRTSFGVHRSFATASFRSQVHAKIFRRTQLLPWPTCTTLSNRWPSSSLITAAIRNAGSTFTPTPLDDPFNRNRLKGRAIWRSLRSAIFLNITGFLRDFFYSRRVPSPSNSAVSVRQPRFLWQGSSFFDQTLVSRLILLHGDAVFKPVDWRIASRRSSASTI